MVLILVYIWFAAYCLDVSVAGLAAHVAATRLRRQDLYFVVVATSGAVQANFDLREEDKMDDMNNWQK